MDVMWWPMPGTKVGIKFLDDIAVNELEWMLLVDTVSLFFFNGNMGPTWFDYVVHK